MSLTIGLDIGGTKIAGGVVDEAGNVLRRERVVTEAESPDAITAALHGLVKRLRGDDEIEAVGIGAAGYVDATRSRVLFAPNVAWNNVPLRADLEALVDLPVVVENDANAAAWGEFRFGAGLEDDDLTLVTVGTGVGGGLVFDGRLFRGSHGVGAEIGHLRVMPGGLLCGCGQRGCWEQYASGNALVRRTREKAATDPAGAELAATAGGADKIDGPMITAAAKAGDEFAIAQLAELGSWLGQGIASLAAVLDPAVVAVGGGVAEADELLLGPARDAYREHLSGYGKHPDAAIRLAQLGNDAGMIGAADLARIR